MLWLYSQYNTGKQSNTSFKRVLQSKNGKKQEHEVMAPPMVQKV